jgi:DNA-binding HxlR family transcriptional regulator
MPGSAQPDLADSATDLGTTTVERGAVAAGRTGTVEAPPSDAVCPHFHQAVELVGKRWTGVVLGALLPGPRRFCEIAQAIPQISDRLLSMRLRELEAEDMVEREVLDGSPVRVRYALTDKGRALEPALQQLQAWARDWLRSG